MTKFEQRGVEFQYEAASRREADSKFSYSCNICCNRGLMIECDRCAIRATHDLTVAYFATRGRMVQAKVMCQG